jgi:Hint module
MKDLRVGDMVLTQDGVYERVYAFGHHAPSKKAKFLQLFTDNAAPLEMTGEHLVYLANRANPVKAASVRPGDVLRGAGDAKDIVIQDIRTVEKKGMYAPLTTGGRLLVDGVQVSSYVSIQDTTSTDSATQQSAVSSEYLVIQGSKVQIPIMSHQEYVHMALAPYRMMCRVAGNAICDTTSSSIFSGREGMPSYISFGIWFNRSSSRHLAVHPWAVITTILLTSPFWFLEKAISSDYFGLTLFVFAALWAVRTAKRKSRRL